MKLKTVNISDLKPHPQNPNQHPQEQLNELQDSLKQFDQVKNIVVWKGLVVAGNGLLMAAEKQGRKEIEVRDVSDWPEEKAIKFMIADNRLAEIAIMDDDILSDLLKGFDEPLDIPGIDENFLDKLDVEPGKGSEEVEDNYAEQFGVIVMCENENHQEEVFNFLKKKGYSCKIVNT